MRKVTLTKSEVSRARTATSAYSARRSSKPKNIGITTLAEGVLVGQTSARVFIPEQKSDLYGTMSRTSIVMIDGMPHKVRGGKYVPLKPATQVAPELFVK